MKVRLLVVVLTLIGAVPIRICTCGAAHACERSPEPAGQLPPGVSSEPAQPEHESECQAVKPRPLMSIGLAYPAADIPPADGLAVAIVDAIQPGPTAGYAVRVVDPPPFRPHFQTDTVLLI